MSSSIGVFDSLPLPDHLQHTILERTLISRSCETLFSFLKLYIYRYGIDRGPIKNLPYHPVYPFLTLIQFNYRFNFFLPEEAYHLLWYLCDLYTIGIIFDKARMLPYLEQCQLNARVMTSTNLRLCKWLNLFGSLTYWQDQFRQSPWKYSVVLFSASPQVSSTPPTGDRLVHRNFQTSFLCGYEDLLVYDTPPVFHEIRVQLCLANRFDPARIPQALLQQETANWENTYPPGYVQIIRELRCNFAEQYVEMSLLDEDHPCYRVDLMPYPLYHRTRYGHYVFADTNSDSE